LRYNRLRAVAVDAGKPSAQHLDDEHPAIRQYHRTLGKDKSIGNRAYVHGRCIEPQFPSGQFLSDDRYDPWRLERPG
jgi:hypothetical protein